MITFCKKKKKKIFIPKENIREFLTLHDTYRESWSLVDRYDLWTFIFDILPDADEGLAWEIFTSRIMAPYIQEV